MTRAMRTRTELEAEMVAADLEYRMALVADDTEAADVAGERFDRAMEQWRRIPEQREAS
jgi:hypothetical protein